MREKTGATAKLVHQFPTNAVLEIQIKGKWYRTTCRDFRSFDGNRRYIQPIKQPGLKENLLDVRLETVEYKGPLYAYDTNQKITGTNSETIQSNHNWVQMRKNSEKQNKFKI